MNHNRIRNDRAQALIHNPDTDELDTGALDPLCHVLRVANSCIIARLASRLAIRQDEHDLSELRANDDAAEVSSGEVSAPSIPWGFCSENGRCSADTWPGNGSADV